MKRHTIKIVLILALFLFPSVPFAYAAMNVISGGVDEGAALSAGGNVKASVVVAPATLFSPAQTSTQKKTQEDAQKGENGTKVEGVVTAGTSTDAGGVNGRDQSMKTFETYKVDFNVGIIKTLIDAENKTGGGVGQAKVDTADKVYSWADFNQFVARKVKADAHIKGVELNNGKVGVTYEEPAKLFGFIGTTILAHTSVDKKGNVEVTYPWYHIFMKKPVSQASLRSAITGALAAAERGRQAGVASTTIQATIATSLNVPNIFELIVNTLKTNSAPEAQ